MPPIRLTYAQAVENAIDEILRRGTAITSFYHGNSYHHNVLIGAHKAGGALQRQTLYGETMHNRALATFGDGRTVFVGIMNNMDHRIGLFTLDQIRNFSYLRDDHFYAKAPISRWQRLKWWLVRKLA